MRYLLWLIFFTLLTLRFINFYQSQPSYPNGTKLRITDTVLSEPIHYTNSQYLKLSGFRVYLPLYPEVYYADMIAVEGEVDGEKLKEARLIKIEEGKGILFDTRKNLIGFYQRSLPQPHSSLIAGIAIGSKTDIGKDFWEVLKRSGTAHVVVASGMNVTLVSSFLISFFTLILPRTKAIPLALVGVWSYALLSGFDSPIIRASIMGSLVFVAQEMGRLNFSLRTLFITASAMLFIKPDWIEDSGFLLSFAATLSLILFEPRVNGFFGKFEKIPNFVRKDFSTSLAAQVGVTPILLFNFGQFNVFSPLINTAVLWTIVPITLIGMVGGVLGLIYEPFGKLLLMLTYPLTSWFVWVVKHTGVTGL